jgi:uncharacterized RDD family membrane protein YckC
MTPRPPPYAGVVTRAVALVIDVVIVDVIALTASVVVGLVLSTIIPGKQSLDVPAVVASATAWLVFVGGYFAGFWTLVARTPGMRLMGLELVTADGGTVGLTRALARLGGMVLAAIPFGAGFLLSLVDDRRQGLQDKIAGTLVLYASPRARAAEPVAPLAHDPARARARAHGLEPADETVEGTVLPPGARPA